MHERAVISEYKYNNIFMGENKIFNHCIVKAVNIIFLVRTA
jgi:hypothetical protein